MEAAIEPTTKRRSPRSTARPVDPKPKRTKVGLLLSDEAAKRLGLHALMTGQDRSDLVDQLIRSHLRGWVVQFRGERECAETVSVTADPAV